MKISSQPLRRIRFTLGAAALVAGMAGVSAANAQTLYFSQSAPVMLHGVDVIDPYAIDPYAPPGYRTYSDAAPSIYRAARAHAPSGGGAGRAIIPSGIGVSDAAATESSADAIAAYAYAPDARYRPAPNYTPSYAPSSAYRNAPLRGGHGLSALNASACGLNMPDSMRPNAEKLALRTAREYRPTRSGDVPPYAVKLEIVERDLPGGYMAVRNCGASYIGDRWLLTAAHCVAEAGWIRIEAMAGAPGVDDDEALRRVAVDAVCHAGFDPQTLANDVALLRVEKPFPAALPKARLTRGAAGLHYYGDGAGVGWRRTGDGGVSNRGRRAGLTLNGRQQSGFILASPKAGARNSICLGESGGPAIAPGAHGDEQIGVFSAVERVYQHDNSHMNVESCDAPDTRLLFTPVADYAGWISAVMNACDADPQSCRPASAPLALMRQ